MIFFGVIATSLLLPQTAESQAGTPITGWAWSDTIGWIKMSDTGYGFTVDQPTGTVSGYAWSDNIGWVSARATDIASCAGGATSKLQNGAWTGWLRAIEGGSAQSGGWDGCISMSGAGYGVVVDTNGSFKPCNATTQSCAWEGNTDPGAAVVGWVDFSYARYQCTPPQTGTFCEGSSSCFYDTSCLKQCNVCAYGCNVGDGQ